MVKTLKRTALTQHMMEFLEQEVGIVDLTVLTLHMIPGQKVGTMNLTALTLHMMEIPEQELSTMDLTISSLTFHKVSTSLCECRHNVYSSHALKYVILDYGCFYG